MPKVQDWGKPQSTRPPRPPAPKAFVQAVRAPSTGFQTDANSEAQVTTVWDRQSVPPSYRVHKRYEALYLLGLDVSRLPSSSELRSAYRKAAMESHPDRQQNHNCQDDAKKLFQKVKDAFDLLNAAVK
ncbi:unnamed protein product [Effrenium voratum]|nr:unnamed protein product [Effrenium voratum]